MDYLVQKIMQMLHLDFSYEIGISSNDEELVNHLDLILCGGRLKPSSKQIITEALEISNLTNAR